MWETWVGKIPLRRARLPTPVFWPGELHGLYSPWGQSQTRLSNLHFHSIFIRSPFSLLYSNHYLPYFQHFHIATPTSQDHLISSSSALLFYKGHFSLTHILPLYYLSQDSVSFVRTQSTICNIQRAWHTGGAQCIYAFSINASGKLPCSCNGLLPYTFHLFYQQIHLDWFVQLLLLLLLSRFSCVRLCATPQTASYQAPLSLGFSRCMKVKSESEVAQSCPTLSDPMDCSLPGSTVHGIFQARVLEWGATAFSNYTFLIIQFSAIF